MRVVPECPEQIDLEEKLLLKKQVAKLEGRIEQGGHERAAICWRVAGFEWLYAVSCLKVHHSGLEYGGRPSTDPRTLPEGWV